MSLSKCSYCLNSVCGSHSQGDMKDSSVFKINMIYLYRIFLINKYQLLGLCLASQCRPWNTWVIYPLKVRRWGVRCVPSKIPRQQQHHMGCSVLAIPLQKYWSLNVDLFRGIGEPIWTQFNFVMQLLKLLDLCNDNCLHFIFYRQLSFVFGCTSQKIISQIILQQPQYGKWLQLFLKEWWLRMNDIKVGMCFKLQLWSSKLEG